MTISLARMIDHSLLHPTMTNEQLREGCELAGCFGVASVCIKPYAVRDAARWLEGSSVAVGTVIGFPHGGSRISIKRAEMDQAAADGATEMDAVVNVGKVLSDDWLYVADEIQALTAAAHAHGAILKLIFENDFLPTDDPKIRLCEIARVARVDFVKTSTGYGFVKGADGAYSYQGATDHDLKLMCEHSLPAVQVKAAGGIRTLDDLLRVRDIGVTRVGATSTEAILTEARRRGIE